MCPWPRFQARDARSRTPTSSPTSAGGASRARTHKKGQTWEGRGDCIDCNNCVAVCPIGIDIRDGLQLECIGCGLCVDACNDVMERIGRPRELITLDTERNQAAADRRASRRARASVRPRTLIYCRDPAPSLGIGVLIGLSARSSVDINVLHDRNPLFVTLSDGSIRNGYTIKILNKSRADAALRRSTLEGMPGATPGARPERRGLLACFVAANPDTVDQLSGLRHGTAWRARASARGRAGRARADMQPLTIVLTDRTSGAAGRATDRLPGAGMMAIRPGREPANADRGRWIPWTLRRLLRGRVRGRTADHGLVRARELDRASRPPTPIERGLAYNRALGREARSRRRSAGRSTFTLRPARPIAAACIEVAPRGPRRQLAGEGQGRRARFVRPTRRATTRTLDAGAPVRRSLPRRGRAAARRPVGGPPDAAGADEQSIS